MSFTISQSPEATNLYLYPSGDSSCSFTPVGEADNYDCVDDIWYTPNDETDYVESTSTDAVEYDLYDAINHTTETGTINYVKLISRAKSYNAAQSSNGTYINFCSVGTLELNGVNEAPITSSYHDYYSVFYTNPSSVTWTWSDIDNLKFGVKCQAPMVTGTYSELFYPDDDGDVIECTPFGAAENWDCVDETGAGDGDTTYVYRVGGNRYDLYTINDYNAVYSGGSISEVKVYTRVRKVLNNANVDIFLKTGGTLYNSGNKAVTSTSYSLKSHSWDHNPKSGVTWTWNDINNLQIGMQLKDNNIHCTQCFCEVFYTEQTSPVRITQDYAVVNYTPATSTVTLNTPETLSVSHSRNIERYTFPDGEYDVYDSGRSGKTLSITGQEISSATTSMDALKTMCHYGQQVTIAGLPDINLNTDYMIKNFSFNQNPGEMNRYHWSLELEEV